MTSKNQSKDKIVVKSKMKPTYNKSGKLRKVKPYLCKSCETTDISKFYVSNKSTCKDCKKKRYDILKSKDLLIDNKICKKCKKDKLSINFYKSPNNLDGLSSNCKKCHSNKENDRGKKYRKNNPQKQKDYNNNYSKNIRRKKPVEVILCRLRTRNWTYLNSNNIDKQRRIKEELGCSPLYLTLWIKYNRDLDKIPENDYHIDHVFPLSRFECKTPEDIIMSQMNHWTNLKPLTEKDNLEKHNRLPTNEEISIHNHRIIDFIILMNNSVY